MVSVKFGLQLQEWDVSDYPENELHLPPRNPFIPTNFDLYPVEENVSKSNVEKLEIFVRTCGSDFYRNRNAHISSVNRPYLKYGSNRTSVSTFRRSLFALTCTGND